LDVEARLDPNVSGELRRLDNGGYKISVNGKEHPFRRRFTMAHELAHFYLHASLVGKGTDDNKVYKSTSDGRFYNQNIEKKHEYEANSFAIFILMPEHLIERWIDENAAGVPLDNSCVEQLAEHLQGYWLSSFMVPNVSAFKFDISSKPIKPDVPSRRPPLSSSVISRSNPISLPIVMLSSAIGNVTSNS